MPPGSWNLIADCCSNGTTGCYCKETCSEETEHHQIHIEDFDIFEDQVENCFSFDGMEGILPSKWLVVIVWYLYLFERESPIWNLCPNVPRDLEEANRLETRWKKEILFRVREHLSVGYSHSRKISAITSSNWNKKCGCQILWLVIWFIVFYEFRQLQRSRFMELAGVLLASALQIGRCHGYGSNPLSSGCVIFMEKRSPLFTSIWICPEI